MSPRIRELALQAGLIAPHASDREGLVDFDYRKFAELIVQECITNLCLNGHDDAMIQIQKHFEVEP